MSTANFHNQKNFKLYIKSFEPISIEEYEKDYFQDSFKYDEYLEESNEELKRYILEQSYDKEMEFWCEMFYRDIIDGYDGFIEEMNSLNDILAFHKLELKDGYYDGVQIYVVEKENPHELDNDDCNYYYDMCRSKAIRKYDSEIRKINKWMDKVASQYGWKEIYCVGVFSNGEAIYSYA